MPQACPCDPARRYESCCAPLHSGMLAASAEALMRSRYSAFVLGLTDYLLATWHPNTRPGTLSLDGELRWLGLDVQACVSTGVDSATVRFVARSRRGGGSAERHVETSRFLQQDGRWFYLEAKG